MENNENLVTEEVTENVEQTTEEAPKLYSEEDFNKKFNDAFGKKKARLEAKIRKEYDRKYGRLEEVLRAGTGQDNVEDITTAFEQHYVDRGVEIPKKLKYTDADIAVLAAAEADEIIGGGYEEVVEEVDRLSNIGVAKMTPREKAVFPKLAEYRKATEDARELSSIGVEADVLESPEFKRFSKDFVPGTSVKKIYEIYQKTLPKKEIKTMGSMRQSQGERVKDYYSPEEIERLSSKDLKDPQVWAAVRRSMTGK